MTLFYPGLFYFPFDGSQGSHPGVFKAGQAEQWGLLWAVFLGAFSMCTSMGLLGGFRDPQWMIPLLFLSSPKIELDGSQAIFQGSLSYLLE